jgi:hypothetical protein
VLSIGLALLLGSFPPRVEDPLPDSIGLGVPFVLAGAAGVLASVVYADSPTQRRDRAVRLFGRAGFYAGVALYVVSLAVQVVSEL